MTIATTMNIRIKAMGFLSGKRILVTGVASKLSIAYGIAQAMHRERSWRSPTRTKKLPVHKLRCLAQLIQHCSGM
jgi:enoyl-[acyl-carrier-protein] reductase (NADH)